LNVLVGSQAGDLHPRESGRHLGCQDRCCRNPLQCRGQARGLSEHHLSIGRRLSLDLPLDRGQEHLPTPSDQASLLFSKTALIPREGARVGEAERRENASDDRVQHEKCGEKDDRATGAGLQNRVGHAPTPPAASDPGRHQVLVAVQLPASFEDDGEPDRGFEEDRKWDRFDDRGEGVDAGKRDADAGDDHVPDLAVAS